MNNRDLQPKECVLVLRLCEAVMASHAAGNIAFPAQILDAVKALRDLMDANESEALNTHAPSQPQEAGIREALEAIRNSIAGIQADGFLPPATTYRMLLAEYGRIAQAALAPSLDEAKAESGERSDPAPQCEHGIPLVACESCYTESELAKMKAAPSQAAPIEEGELREALKPFARFAEAFDQFSGTMPKTGEFYVLHTGKGRFEITVEDFKRAHAAITTPPHAGGLAWTREKPTAEGHYWFRSESFLPSVAEIGEIAGVLAVFSEDHDGEPLKGFTDFEWAGPIPEPQARQEEGAA